MEYHEKHEPLSKVNRKKWLLLEVEILQNYNVNENWRINGYILKLEQIM